VRATRHPRQRALPMRQAAEFRAALSPLKGDARVHALALVRGRWLALPMALALWTLLTVLGLQSRVDRVWSDLLERAASSTLVDPPSSVLVDIDDPSLRGMSGSLGEWPYSRDVYALLLDYLRQVGAELVVIDIVLAGPRQGDERLAMALPKSPRTVLASAGLLPGRATVELTPPSEAERQALKRLAQSDGPGVTWEGLTVPADPLMAVLTSPGSLGVISARLDDDGILRQVPLLHRVHGHSLPSLALAARIRADGGAGWQFRDGELIVGKRRWPVDGEGRLKLRWPADGGALPRLGWTRLMRAALGESHDPELARLLTGRSVFVGSSAFFADEVMTPHGRLSGAAWHAAVFEALGAGEQAILRSDGPTVQMLNFILFALGGLPLVWRRQAPAALLALLGMGGLAWAGAQAGWLGAPAAGLWLLGLAMLFTALERQRQARRRELELSHQRGLAEAQSRAKTELLAQVSHEMRTPMNAVLGMAEVLARSPLGAEQARQLEVLSHAGRQAFALINDLLDNARIESGKLELASKPFNVVDLVELQLELQRARAQQQGLWLRVFARTEGADWVLGDAPRVAQIVANLVANAIKFTERGGVTVELLREAKTDANPGFLLIRVKDTGIGIASHKLERIFRPFEQAGADIQRDFGGTGLGLSITRSLALLMGGDVRVQSDPGQGSVFEVRLKLPEAMPPQDAHPRPRLERIAPTRSLSLLLAEDNDVNVIVIEGMLQPLGHHIQRVVDGEQALLALEKKSFDLVLMDMLMPKMDGLEATRRWRVIESQNALLRTPIVALTANASASDVRDSLLAGCDEHVSKPVGLATLLAVLARLTEP